jgi:hypothetical protein
MTSQQLIRMSVALATLTVAAGACRQKATPTDETLTTTGEQPRLQPITVTGCLRAGEAENTFVLTTAQAAGAGETATYQLTGLEGVNLRDHVGHQVEVSGTVRSEQDMASRSPDVPATRARGTSGTPVVRTETELQVKRLEVSVLKPVGGECRSEG